MANAAKQVRRNSKLNSLRSKFLTAPALAVAPASATMTAGQAHDSESVREKRRAHALCLSANSPGRIVEARTIAFPAIALHRIDTERSEEHTSELQSLMRISYAVFCLKKKNHDQHRNTPVII